MKMHVETRRDSTGRLDHLAVRKGRRRRGVDLQFLYGTDGFLRDIEFSGREEDMPSIPDIIALVNEKFMERIGTIKKIGEVGLVVKPSEIKNFKEPDVLLAQDDTKVSTGVTDYVCKKMVVLPFLSADKPLEKIMVTGCVDSGTGYIKVTTQVGEEAEVTQIEEEMTNTTYDYFSRIDISVFGMVKMRVYLKHATGAGAQTWHELCRDHGSVLSEFEYI